MVWLIRKYIISFSKDILYESAIEKMLNMWLPPSKGPS